MNLHRCHGIFLALFIVLLSPMPLHAHKIKVFASAEGKLITGYGYYPGGGKYKNSPILIYGPAGKQIGKTRTDGNGLFRYTPLQRVDHTFVIATPDGHRAEYTVPASALPETLAAPTDRPVPVPPPSAAARPPAPGAVARPAPLAPERLAEVVEKAVARQITPLRRQLDAYEEKIRLHDILGGIGYILGITGLLCFYLARAKKTNNPKGEKPS